MARLNKFASVNLNDSYGKPERSGSTNNNSTSSSNSGKSRISPSGGMLVLTRPGRPQPPSPSPKPGQARLGIPSPVNLPSLKRENSGSEILAASPPLAGWSKGESPPLTGWTKGESPTDPSPLNQKVGLSRSLDMADESLKAMSLGKSDVYAPPALRAMQTGVGFAPRVLPPTPPPEKPSAIIRGEEFPTLQAAVARPPTPPQHPRQKDLQLKQRERQQEMKEQQLKLQQLSLVQGQKQIQGDSSQFPDVNIQDQPTLSLRPLGKQENCSHKSTVEGSGSESSLYTASIANPISEQANSQRDGSLSRSGSGNRADDTGHSLRPQYRNPISDQANDQLDGSLSRSIPAVTLQRADDAGHSFRPQYRSPLPVSQGIPNLDVRSSGVLEPSWSNSSRREFAPPIRNGDQTKFPGTNVVEDLGRVSTDLRSSSFGKDSYFSRDPTVIREITSPGFGRGDATMDQEGFGKEVLDSRLYGRSSTLVHDAVPRIEGFYSQRSFGREAYNRDPREVNNRTVREANDIDTVDMYSKDNRNVRENHPRDTGDIFDRDVREAYNRDTRDVYTRDVREVHNQDAPMNKQSGHGYSSYNGDYSWRGNASHIDSPHGRGGIHTTGIPPVYSPGSGHDTYYNRRHGPQVTGEQFFAKDTRPGPDYRAPRGIHIDSTVSYSTSEGLGSRKSRSPASGFSSFDPVKDVHEVHLEKTHRVYEGDRPILFEDKGVDVKHTSNEQQGSGFTGQKHFIKGDSPQGSTTRVTSKKHDDEGNSREDLKKQLLLEDERRKEAARLKLMELEERIARRAVMEVRKEEFEIKSKEQVDVPAMDHQHDIGHLPGTYRFEQEGRGSLSDRDMDAFMWKEGDPGPKLARPSSASSSSSWTYKTSGEGHATQEQDFRLVAESELNQDRKVVRSRSPGSWRKEIGSGPTSKLFSSPYIESGGFRRPTDGGTYKLF